MLDHRDLENKFKNDIEHHLVRASFELFKEFGNFTISSDEEDTKLSFDMKFYLNFQVSVRIRKHKYIKYDDATIRYKSKHRQETEIDKINKGLSQVYFYAYMNEAEDELIKIRIFNTEAIRKLHQEGKYTVRYNKDTTALSAFKFTDIKQLNHDIYKYDKI
jgi:asparagine N-glycosylation enzyme membrane subunit Stt3